MSAPTRMPAGAAAETVLIPPGKPGPIRILLAAGVIAGGALLGAVVAYGTDHVVLMAFALLGLASVAVLLTWPDLALPLAVFLIWTNIPTLIVYKGAPTVLTAAIPMILLAPILVSILRGQILTIDRTFLYSLVLLGVFVASTVVSRYPEVGVDRTITLVTEGLVLYLLVFNVVRTPEGLRRATWALLAAGSFMAAITVFQNVTQSFDRQYLGFSPLDLAYVLGKSDAPRAAGPVADANYYAQILVTTIALCVPSLWRARDSATRIVFGTGVMLMAAAVAFTFSRGGMLALVLVLCALVFLGYLKLRHLGAVALAVVLLVSLVPGYSDRISSFTKLGGITAQQGSSNEADIAARGRFVENLSAILVFFDYPLLGVGPGSFKLYYQEYAQRTGGTVHQASKRGEDAGEAPQREAHSLFLSTAAETGLPGLLARCAVFWAAFAQLARARRRWVSPDPASKDIMTGLLLALMAYIAAGVFLTLAFERYLWLLLAIMGAAAYVARQQASSTNAAAGSGHAPQ